MEVDCDAYVPVPEIKLPLQQPLSEAEMYTGIDGVKALRLAIPHLKRYERERRFRNVFGTIKGVQVIGYANGSFTTRITTDRMILRGVFGISHLTPLEDMLSYDPWDMGWYHHLCRVKELTIVKKETDPGDLYATQLTERMREMMLKESPAMLLNDPEKDVWGNVDGGEENLYLDLTG